MIRSGHETQGTGMHHDISLHRDSDRRRGGIRCWAAGIVCLFSLVAIGLNANATDPSQYLSSAGQHRVFSADAQPGMIGYGRSLGHGPIAGYFQPVAFTGPDGVQFALSQGGTFVSPEDHLMAGLQIGRVYRMRMTGLPDAEGAELYPSVEVIDRTYPPPGLETTYPIQIVLDRADIDEAMAGRMVTKVIYLEDPQTAFAEQEKPDTGRVIDVGLPHDPLEVADRFGRPVAIVRIGTLAPPSSPVLVPQFFFGDPTWAPIYQPEVEPVP